MSITAENLETERQLAEATSNRSRKTMWLRAGLGLGVLLAVACAALHPELDSAPLADAKLGQLLRGIALIKGALTVLALVLVYWRLARPVSTPAAAAYLGGVWFMAGASVLVWGLVHVGWGALLFHAGELTILLVVWREHQADLVPVRR